MHLLKEERKNNMSYTIEDMLLLLISIKNKGTPDFVEDHISFGTVGYLCSEAIKQGYIVRDRNELILVDKGLLFIEETNKKLKKKGINKEIATLPDAYGKKISIEDIYLPEKI